MAFPEINRVVLVSRLTRDPELEALPSGDSVCNLRVASNGVRFDEDEDGYVQRPNYFSVAVFEPQAESVAEYTRKGSQVVVDGRLEWSEWEDEDGEPRQGVRIVADSVQFVSEPKSSSASRGRASRSSRATRSRATTNRARTASKTRASQSGRGRSTRSSR